ncbi:hypothetical protein [Candidatus Planktophila versatilis]|uniref:Glycosyltransferase RgtA/B/C/D-like domain-containing protein n=1 Tax=Candidatus Planktophila versatilis TaxID=1884905 RepID=A0ABM6MFW1_9ACTN|nr:hypothetical protein [Candidatus Planktophila versatilis]ASY17773.1 hypothetical protein A1sIA79_06180 [Candidatus Planktophila versatilis]
MASKSKMARQQQVKKSKNVNFYIIAIPVLGFLIKLITMINTPNGGWLGADGENYFSGVDGLLADGYLSDKSILSYWPAGYPILLWGLAKISVTQIIWLISITQTLFYAYASYYFVKQLRDTKLRPYLFLIGIILAINPTLSLSSMAVGYESPIAACMLMVVGLIIKSLQSPNDRRLVIRVLGVGGFSALATFMQPRWLLTSIVIAVVWALMSKSRKVQALILVGVIGVMAIAPAILIQRNIASIDKAVISTNLGVTMRIGAGPQTTGGYSHTGPDVPCDPVPPATTVSDNDVVKCVIKWYAANPVKAGKLFVKKGWYYWTPWSGPLGNGTMARNPWLKVNPIMDIARGSQSGNDLVYKSVGKGISFFWVVGCISLFFIGFFWLRSMKGIYANIAWLTGIPVVISWLISMGTIGDHRFRIPTMSLSLFLQVMGYFALRHKAKTRSFAVALESSAKAR